MTRRFCLVVLALVSARPAAAQEADITRPIQPNSIAQLISERPPQLQAGFVSDSDRWILYSPRFDVLSAPLQRALLRKYGYLTSLDGTAGDLAIRESAQEPPGFDRFAILQPGTNVKVTSHEAEVGTRLQSETSIAVSGQNIVVFYNDEFDSISYSRDGGSTWRQARLPHFTGSGFASFGDPIVAAGPDGRFYAASIYVTSLGYIVLGIAHSDDGGATWSSPVNVTASMTGRLAGSHDKPWMAADNTPGSPYRGNVYMSWTLFNSDGTSDIRFTRSGTGGQTWSPPIALARLATSDLRQVLQGSFIATGPKGEVYVTWYDSRVNGMRIRKSTDGGATFSAEVTALAPLGFVFSTYVNGGFDVPAFGQAAVDCTSGATGGNVYVAANVRGAAGDTDIVLARSTDGGATWSAPVSVNNDATRTDQFMPALAVAGDGSVGVAFYDRRNDPANNLLTDVYVGISRDGGTTFPVNQRVTTTVSPVLPTPTGVRAGYHGDYNQVTASGGNFYIAWSDDRSGQDPDVFVAVVPTSGAVADFVLAPTKPAADVVAGGQASFDFTTGGTPGVTLSATASATGVSLEVRGTTVTATTTPATASGTYTITVTGKMGTLERGGVVRLTVHAPELRQPPTGVTELGDPAYNVHASIDSAGTVHLATARENEWRRRKRISYTRIPAGGPAQPSRSVAHTDLTVPEMALLDPRVATDSSGRVYVAYRRSDRNGLHVLLSTSTDGVAFSVPADVSRVSTSTGLAYQPALAIGKNGTVFVAFVRASGREIAPGVFLATAFDVLLTRSADQGATFDGPVNVSRYNSTAPTIQLTSPPALVLDSSDNPHIAWVARVAGTQDVYYARSRDGGATFEPVLNVSRGTDPNVSPSQPSIAIDSAANVYVSWTNPDLNFGQQDILVARSSNGGPFTTIANVSGATYWTGAVADWSAIGVDSSGGVTVAWRQSVSTPLKSYDTQRDVFFSRSTDRGATWTIPVNLSSNLGDTLLGGMPPALVADASGKIQIFWDDDTPGSSQIVRAVVP